MAKKFGRHYVHNKFNVDYFEASDKMCAIQALGVQRTKWNNIFHDQCGDEQKLYCCLPASNQEVLLKCKYSSDSVLIAVHEPHHFKGIGEKAPHLVAPVLDAIRTVYPQAEVVGEEQFIRVLF